MRIHPRNLYAILCYAWDVLERAEEVPVGLEEATVPRDLLARIVAREADRLRKRGLQRQYEEQREDLESPRGAVLIDQTLTRALLPQRRVACRYDEHSLATPLNRLLRGALEHAARLPLDAAVAAVVRAALRAFPCLPPIPLDSATFGHLRYDRQNAPYRLAMHAAELLVTDAVATSGGSGRRLDDFTQDEHRMGRLFQRFVRRFLEVEQGRWTVSAPHLAFAASGDRLGLARLPQLETDLVLGRRGVGEWIVELKCVRETLQRRNGRSRLRSDHLYQVLAYLETRAHAGRRARGGVLLYAESDAGPLRHDLVVNGHPLRVRTVPLQGSWAEVRGALLALVDELARPDA